MLYNQINRKYFRGQSGVIAGVVDALLATLLATGLTLLIVNTGICIYYKLKFSQAASVALNYARDRALKTTRFESDPATTTDIQTVVDFALNTMGISTTTNNVTVRVDPTARIANRPAVTVTISMPVQLVGPFGRQVISDTEVSIYPDTVNYLGFQCSPGGTASAGRNGGYKIVWVPIVAAPPMGSPLPAETWWLSWARRAEIDHPRGNDHHHEPVGDPFVCPGASDTIHGYCYVAPNMGVGSGNVEARDSTPPPAR